MLSFHKTVESDFAAVNRLIIDQLHSEVGLVESIGHYIVEAGGKRLRPLLVLLSAKALGYQGSQHINMAAIIEFIHTATLLHDDVVDVSNLRRGRPTANAQWGNAPSVLVGDFLYSRAFQMMVDMGSMEIMAILSNTTNVISEGEVQQLVNAKDPEVDEDNYFNVVHKKTAALFEAACDTAAVLSGTDNRQRQDLCQYGYHLGMAFQLVDDALDYEGDADTLGKNVGDDLVEGKPTLPLIHAMKHGSRDDAKLIAELIREGDQDKALSQLHSVVAIVKNTGALDYTKNRAQQHVAQAKELLRLVPPSVFSTALLELAEFSVSRQS